MKSSLQAVAQSVKKYGCVSESEFQPKKKKSVGVGELESPI